MKINNIRQEIVKRASMHIKKSQEEVIENQEEFVEEEPLEKAIIEEKPKTEQKTVEDVLNTVLDQQEEILENQNEILDKIEINPEEEFEEEELEDHKEELEELEEEEITSEEFGISTEDMFSAGDGKDIKEGSMKDLNLRKARNLRLRKGASDVKNTLSEEWNAENAKNKSYKTNIPTPPSNKAKVPISDIPEMYKLANINFHLSKDKKSWTLVSKLNGKDIPLYKINYKDEYKEKFATEDFTIGILEDIPLNGLDKALEKYSAEILIEVVKEEPTEEVNVEVDEVIKGEDTPEEIAEDIAEKITGETPVVEMPVEEIIEEEASTEMTAESDYESFKKTILEQNPDWDDTKVKNLYDLVNKTFKQSNVKEKAIDNKVALNDYKRRFVRAFKLSLSAMQNNYVENPLKGSFFDILSNLDIPEDQATLIIEKAFADGSEEHFEKALQETEKYLNMSDEAFVEVESSMQTLQTRVPITASLKSRELSDNAKELRKRAARNSIPFDSSSDSDISDKNELIKQALPKPQNYGAKKLFSN